MAPFHDAVREALEQAERGAAGGDAGSVITAQFVALMGISRHVATKIDELSMTITNMHAGGGGADIRMFPLTKARGIEKVPSFSGNKSEYTDWTKRVEIFLGDAPVLRKMLKDIKTEYRNETVNDEILNKLSNQETDQRKSKKLKIIPTTEDLQEGLQNDLTKQGLEWTRV